MNRPSKVTLAKYLVAIAASIMVGVDLVQYLGGQPGPGFRLILFESVVDVVLLLTVYFVLRSEIAARHASEKQLLEADRLKNRFLSMAAHDLRNPLGVIMGAAEVTKEAGPLTPTQKMWLDKISAKSQDMLSLIKEMLDSVVLDQSPHEIKKESADLTLLLSEVVFDQQAQAERKGQKIVLRSTLSPATSRLKADKRRIRQVLANLISNAIKYSPPGEEITILAGCLEGRLHVCIRDRGPGLTEDERLIVFEPFSKVKKKTTAGESSTGLGLSIAKVIVEKHGGVLSVESAGTGQGSEFKIELPASV